MQILHFLPIIASSTAGMTRDMGDLEGGKLVNSSDDERMEEEEAVEEAVVMVVVSLLSLRGKKRKPDSRVEEMGSITKDRLWLLLKPDNKNGANRQHTQSVPHPILRQKSPELE
eukprot:gene13225-27986_t